MSASVKIAISDAIYKSTTISISQSVEIPLVEGNSMTCEIIVPEKNEYVEDSVLDAAKAAKQRIAIRPARLQLLLDVEKKLKKLEDAKRDKLEALHQKEKSNSAAVNERVRKYV